jgi:hypothetical protein
MTRTTTRIDPVASEVAIAQGEVLFVKEDMV